MRRLRRALSGRRPRVVVITTCSNARLPMARVIAGSLRRWNPGVHCVAVVADEPSGEDSPLDGLELVWASELGIPHYRELAFGYEREPLTYAITSPAVAHVLAKPDIDVVIFIKQESLVVGPLDPVISALAQRSIALTPHLLTPLEGRDAADRELVISCAGIYNAGVVGVRDDACGRRFAEWWASRVPERCVIDAAAGLHYEQRWLDLVPTLFDSVCVVRDRRVNVGHWNMRERRLSVDGELVKVDGEQGSVIRFSGYEPERPDAVTKYTDRPRMDELHGAPEVFALYRRLLMEAGHEAAAGAPYGYARFADGAVIPPLARELYRATDAAEGYSGDPFGCERGSFREWLAAPCGTGAPVVSRFWDAVWRRRIDFQAEFPGHLDGDRERFARWTRTYGPAEYEAPDEL